ncbi:CamS family sex pheromone protein [Staphylococcus aureus]
MIAKLNKVNKWLSEILSRLRENDDLKDIPIHFAIYKQSS